MHCFACCRYASDISAIASSAMLNIVKRVWSYPVNGSIIGRGKKSNGIFSPLLLLLWYHHTLWRIDNCSGGCIPYAKC